MSDNVTIVH